MRESGTGVAAFEDKILPGSLFQQPRTGFLAPPSRPPRLTPERARYMAELLLEKQKFSAVLQLMPNCNRLLNQELNRVSEFERYGGPFRSPAQPTNGTLDLEGYLMMQAEENRLHQRASQFRDDSVSLSRMPRLHKPRIVKKTVRLDVPVDKYPTYNFVGRILGPRGNSLKRIELASGCRVFIRGRGSVKDAAFEEKQKGKPGYEHLNEPLHILVEAELREDLIYVRLKEVVHFLRTLLKPMDESIDYYKKEQLKELAALNGTLREEISQSSRSPSSCISQLC